MKMSKFLIVTVATLGAAGWGMAANADAAGKDLCSSCGHVAGTDQCCAEGAEKCAACGLAKGSALCCKLKPETEEAAAE